MTTRIEREPLADPRGRFAERWEDLQRALRSELGAGLRSLGWIVLVAAGAAGFALAWRAGGERPDGAAEDAASTAARPPDGMRRRSL